MLAICLMLSETYYAQNFTDIIGLGLHSCHCYKLLVSFPSWGDHEIHEGAWLLLLLFRILENSQTNSIASYKYKAL